MSSVVDNPLSNYETIDWHVQSERDQKDPPLRRAEPRSTPLDTPPPLVDAPDDLTQVRPSWTDAILINQLGPGYDPDIAHRAGIELCCDKPEPSVEDRAPDSSYEPSSMIPQHLQEDGRNTSDHQSLAAQALTAPRRASEKLNDAMRSQQPNQTVQPHGFDYHAHMADASHHSSHAGRDKKRVSISITSLTNDEASDTLEVASLSIQGSPVNQQVNVARCRNPPLPPLSLCRAGFSPTTPQPDSIAQSPALSKYAISPREGDPSQTLAKIQSQSSPPSAHGVPAEHNQTLPSLEKALSAVTDMPSSYADPGSAISRPSPNHPSPFDRSPPTFSQTSTVAPLSPPRFSSNPSFWLPMSQNSSGSHMSEHASAPGSNSASTPASSGPLHSPSHSTATPQYPRSEHESSSSEMTPMGNPEGPPDASAQRSGNAPQGYPCTWPDCTAQPFQTEYLLKSHTNVHSTTRTHFCPVKGCPRGHGGQGFKRKNEMIR